MDKRRAAMATLMLVMLAGQTIALPLVVPLVIGGLAGGVIGYLLGTNFVGSDEVSKLRQQYEAALTSQKQINDANIQQLLLEVYARDSNIYGISQDFGQYTKNYAWALAKYEAIKALKEGKTVAEAQAAAKNAVMNYYANVSRTIINTHNATVNLIYAIYQNYSAVDGLSTFEFIGPAGWNHYWDPSTGTWYKPSGDYVILNTTTYTIAGKAYTTNILQSYPRTEYAPYLVKFAGSVVYDKRDFENAVNAIDSAYNEIINNIDVYVQNLASQVNLSQINMTDLIDPYQLASLMNNDYNATGYYGYAAAELALLGLNTTGINKTIVIEVNGTRYEGFLFTDWQGVLETNKTYTANASYRYFIAVDGGLYEIPAGTNFTVLAIRDFNGNELTNVTLKSYTSALQDVNKIYDEIALLRQLWQEYLEMQTMMVGTGVSSDNSLTAWWNSLDTLGKLGVIGIGAVGVYAVLRRK